MKRCHVLYGIDMVCIEETIGPAAGPGLSGRLGSGPYSRPGVVVELFPVSAVARQLSLNIGIPYLHRFQRRRTDSARGLPVPGGGWPDLLPGRPASESLRLSVTPSGWQLETTMSR